MIMSDIVFKKCRFDEKISECCICGESGNLGGFTDIFQISLRSNNCVVQSFAEIIFFTLGIEVQKESSEICGLCKPKIIEFYHFKKRSQSVQKKFSPLLQEIMKIVGNYVSKNSIKAVTIEESKEKLVIMEKSPENSTNLMISEVASFCDVQVKQEEDEMNTGIPEEVEIKKEPPDIEEVYELPANSINPTNDSNDNFEKDATDSTDKLDTILSINKEILELVKSLRDSNHPNNLNMLNNKI